MDRGHEIEGLMTVAQLMCVAARTAPKARGTDLLVTSILAGEDKSRVSAKMREIGNTTKKDLFLRDADNLDAAPAAVLLGTRLEPIGLDFYCNMCQHGSCQQTRETGRVCVFNSHDLGLAVGSAVSVAARHHIDCRIMYTVGIAARDLLLLGKDIRIVMGIPLSVTGKNIFFDRGKKQEKK
jgi:uncharacterized ferredoxin-like protein